jgi:hypothetical protein
VLAPHEDGTDDLDGHAADAGTGIGSEVPQSISTRRRPAPESSVGPGPPGSEVALLRECTRDPIRSRGPQHEPGSSAEKATTVHEEIEMDDYEVICKGIVILGSLQLNTSAVRS